MEERSQLKIKVIKLKIGYLVEYDDKVGTVMAYHIQRGVGDRKALKQVLGGLMVREVERPENVVTICEAIGGEK